MKRKREKIRAPVSGFPGRRREDRHSIYRLLLLTGLLLIGVLLLIIGVQHLQQLRLQRELADYERLIREEQALLEDLTVEIELLQEADYLEVMARQRLGLINPGEVVFQLED